MLIEISEMLDYLDDFVDGDVKETLVGGIAGTEINRFAIEAATKHHDFKKVLVIEGCQDYIGILKNPIDNVKHWTDLCVEEIMEPLVPFDPWKPKVEQPNSIPGYRNKLDTELLSQYEMIVAYDTHLIPCDIKEAISDAFAGQIIWVYDPAEMYSYVQTRQYDIPVITDTLRKLSPILAMARDAIGVETRAIDRKVKGSVVETARMGKRTIGKIDDKQYVTNDIDLLREVNKRQIESPFRKNQRVLIKDHNVDIMLENGYRKASLGYNSMLVIDNPNGNPLMKLRLYNSKTTYFADIAYDIGCGMLRKRGQLRVVPANIIMHDEFVYHRYNHTVLVITYPLTKREKYSILKNSNNVTVVNKFKT